MFTAKVYTVMIGSLSGTMEEVFTAKEVVRQYNQDNVESSGKLFLPVEWSIKPEDLQNVDVVIGIVGNWIDKTDFIEESIKAKKQVLLFFNAFQDPKNTIQSEYDVVKAFRDRMKEHCSWADYMGNNDLCAILSDQLSAL